MRNRYLIWTLPAWAAAAGALWYAAGGSREISARDVAAIADAAVMRGHVAALTGGEAPDLSLPVGGELLDMYAGSTNAPAHPDIGFLAVTAQLCARVATMTNPVWLAADDAALLDADSILLLSPGYAPTASNWTENGIAHTAYLPVGRASGDGGYPDVLFRSRLRTAADRFPTGPTLTNPPPVRVWGAGNGSRLGEAEALTNWWIAMSSWFRGAAQTAPAYSPVWPGGTYWTTNMGPRPYCTPVQTVGASGDVRLDLVPSRATLSAMRAALRGVTHTLCKLDSLSGDWVVQDAYRGGSDQSPGSASYPADFSRWRVGESDTWYESTNSGAITYLSMTTQDYRAYLTNGAPERINGASEVYRVASVRADLTYPCRWALSSGIVERVTLYVVPSFEVYDSPGGWMVNTNLYDASWTRTKPLLGGWTGLVTGAMAPDACAESSVDPSCSESREASLDYIRSASFHGRRAYRVWTSGDHPTNAAAEFGLALGALPVMPSAPNFGLRLSPKSAGTPSQTWRYATAVGVCRPACWLVLVKWADVLN